MQRVSDYWLQHAIDVIKATWGVDVAVYGKSKDLVKFGRSEVVGANSFTTLMTLPTGHIEETYCTGNSITHIVAENAADTGITLSIEGHYWDASSAKVFAVQTIGLSGQTPVALTTPLCRMTRQRNRSSQKLVGNIYGFETGSASSGVPSSLAQVHCMIRAGQQRSEKASTSLSNKDFWIVTGVWGDILEKTDVNAEIAFEVAEQGYVFDKGFDYSAAKSSSTWRSAVPYQIVPPNADVRLSALSSAANTTVSGGIFGVLASVVSSHGIF